MLYAIGCIKHNMGVVFLSRGCNRCQEAQRNSRSPASTTTALYLYTQAALDKQYILIVTQGQVA